MTHPRMTSTYLRFNADNWFEAARKTGDVAKGQVVNLTGVNSKGKFSASFKDGKPSEHWHDLDAFYPTHEKAGNDNG